MNDPIVHGAIILAAVLAVIGVFYGHMRLGWTLPTSLDEAKAAGWPVVLAFVLITAIVSIVWRALGRRSNAGAVDSSRDQRDSVVDDEQDVREDLDRRIDEEDRIGDHHGDQAEENIDRADEHRRRADEAGDRARDALDRADRIRDARLNG